MAINGLMFQVSYVGTPEMGLYRGNNQLQCILMYHIHKKKVQNKNHFLKKNIQTGPPPPSPNFNVQVTRDRRYCQSLKPIPVIVSETSPQPN